MKYIKRESHGVAKKLDTNPKRAMSEKIAADTAAFLAKGGQVHEIPRGIGVEHTKLVLNQTNIKAIGKL